MEGLILKLKIQNLYTDSEGVVLQRYGNGEVYMAIDKDTFLGYYGKTDFSYAQMVAVGTSLGHKSFLDDWKSKGIIS